MSDSYGCFNIGTFHVVSKVGVAENRGVFYPGLNLKPPLAPIGDLVFINANRSGGVQPSTGTGKSKSNFATNLSIKSTKPVINRFFPPKLVGLSNILSDLICDVFINQLYCSSTKVHGVSVYCIR